MATFGHRLVLPANEAERHSRDRLRQRLTRAWGSPIGRTYLVGLPIVGAVAIAGAGRSGTSGELWVNLELAVSAFVALVVAILGLRGTLGSTRLVRRGLTLTLLCVTLAWIVWGLESATIAATPRLHDVILVIAAVSALVTHVADTRRRLAQRQVLALLVDGVTVLGALVAAYIVLLELLTPTFASVPFSVIVVFPPVLMAIAVAALLTGVATRSEPSIRGAYAYAIATGGAGLASAVWVFETLPSGVATPTPATHMIAAAQLLAGWGIATWTDARFESRRYERLARLIEVGLPLGAVLVGAVLLIVSGMLGDPSKNHVGVMLAVVMVFAALRQALLVVERGRLLSRERGALLREQGAHAAAQTTLVRAVAAETEQRHRAELLARILAASESLAVARVGPPAYEIAIAQLVPEGALGFLSRLDEGGQGGTVVAAHGPGAEGIVNVPLPAGILTPEILDRIRTGDAIISEDRAIPTVPYGTADPALAPEERSGGGAALTLPLRGRQGEPLGNLHIVDREPGRITEPTFIDLARLVANQLAVAMENARLVEQLGRQLERLMQMQSHLVRTSRLAAVGEIAAGLAHEVNNPLAGALGYTDLLLESLPAEDPRRADLEVIRDEMLRARRVLRSLLETAGGRMPHLSPHDLGTLVRQAIAVARHRHASAAIRIVDRLEPMPPVELDPDAMRQAFTNILASACQTTRSGGEITVTSSIDGEEVVVAIISEQDRRPANAREPERSGTALDEGGELEMPLAIGIIEGHGGAIVADDRAGGEYSVWVRLPLSSPSDPALDQAAAGDERTFAGVGAVMNATGTTTEGGD